MSKEAVAAFFKKAAEDSALQKKIVELAVAEGFDFSSDELSETDLERIAGGIKLTSFTSPKVKGEQPALDPNLKEWK